MKRLYVAFFCLCFWPFAADAQAPFYQGKTIKVIVGTPPGNLYDLWARLIVAQRLRDFGLGADAQKTKNP